MKRTNQVCTKAGPTSLFVKHTHLLIIFSLAVWTLIFVEVYERQEIAYKVNIYIYKSLGCNCASDTWKYKIRQFKLFFFFLTFSASVDLIFLFVCFQEVTVLYRCFLFNLQSVSAFLTPFDRQHSWEHLWYIKKTGVTML